MIHIARDLRVVPIESLVPYEKNARTHPSYQIDQIVASMKRFGFTNPILLDGDKGIIAGHGRLRAAQKLGLHEVPVIQLAHLSEEEKRAYIIADNKLALNAGWDEATLAAEIEALRDLDFDIDLLGFTDEELADLEIEPEVLPGAGNEDEVPEPPADPKVVHGEVYVLGKHRLMCGDSTVITDVERLMAGAKADVVFTDPPYNLEGNGLLKRTNKGGGATRENFGDWDVGFDPMLTVPIVVASVKPDASVFISTSGFLFGAFTQGMIDAGAKTDYLVWCKKNPMPSLTKKSFVHSTELIVYSRFGSPDFTYPDDGNLKNYFDGNVEPHATGHPSQKPVYVPRACIAPTAKRGSVVLDLFGGSGSTMIACEELGIASRLIELDPKYCQVMLDRWEKFTGKKAHREDGTAWAEIKGAT